MFLLDPLTKALFFTFLAGSMLGIGLKVGRDDLLTVVRDKSWLARVFAANFLLIPALGILAARLLPMKPENGLALIILACAPGGMSALHSLSKKKEAAALAYGGGTTVLLSLLSIFLSPILIGLAIPKGMAITFPYLNAILFVSLFMLLPLVLGIIVHGTSGVAARKLAGPISLVATLAFVGVEVRLLNLTNWAEGEMGKIGLVSIVVIILVAMLIGWLLGGPRKFTRPILATASSMRNVALGLAIAVRGFDIAVLTPLVAFLAIMVPMNLLLMVISTVAGKKRDKNAPVPAGKG